MAAHIRRSSAGHRVSAEARPRDQPPERRSRRRIYAGRRQRPPAQPRSQRRSHSSFGAIPAVAALRNRLRILRTPTRPRRLSSSEPRIATESRWSSPPELLRSKLRPRLSNALPFSSKPAAESVSRFYTGVPAAGLSAATACSTAGRHSLHVRSRTSTAARRASLCSILMRAPSSYIVTARPASSSGTLKQNTTIHPRPLRL